MAEDLKDLFNLDDEPSNRMLCQESPYYSPPSLTPISSAGKSDYPGNSESPRSSGGMPSLRPYPDFRHTNGSQGPPHKIPRMSKPPPHVLYHNNPMKHRRLQNGIPFTVIRLPPPTNQSPAYPLLAPAVDPRHDYRPRVPAMRLRMIRPAGGRMSPKGVHPVLYRAPPPPAEIPRPTTGVPPNSTAPDVQKISLDQYLSFPSPASLQDSSQPSDDSLASIKEIPVVELDCVNSDATFSAPAGQPCGEEEKPVCLLEPLASHMGADVKGREAGDEVKGSEEPQPTKSSEVSSKKMKKKRKKKVKLLKNQVKNLQDACSETIFSADECRMRKEMKTDSPCWQTVINDKLISDIELPSSLDGVVQWGVEDVVKFVSGFARVSTEVLDKFREEMIDGEALILLDEDDLVNHLNLKLGLALKIYHTVLSVKHLKDVKKPPK